MDIGTIFDFDRFCEVSNRLPELTFNIVLSHGSRFVGDRIKGCLVSEVALLEVVGSFLELLQRVDASFLEPKLARANEASRTMPVMSRNPFNWRVETVAMIASVAAVA